MREQLKWLIVAPLAMSGCGDSGGMTASAGATDGGSGTTGATNSASATEPTGGSNSLSDSVTEPTGGSNSLSDSQVSLTEPTDSNSNSNTDSSSNSSSATDSASATDTTIGTTTTTTTGDTSTGTSGGVDTDSSSTGGAPLVCDMPPAGFEGPDDPNCDIEPQVGAFNPVAEWSKSTWSMGPTFTQVMAAPIVVSLTDDNADGKINDLDVPDIVFSTFAGGGYSSPGWLRAVSGNDGKEILNIGNQSINGASGVAGGDIDGDGIVELIAVTNGGVAKAFEHDGTLKWTSPALGASIYSCPAIADMNADGKPEVIVGKTILNNDGTVRATVKYGFGSLVAVVVDLDGDGNQELVGGNAVYDVDGKEQWYKPALNDGWVGVADMDLDSFPDIIVVSAGKVRLQTGLGVVKWDVAFPGGGGGPPTIADYDADGQPEIGVAGKTGYVVFESDGKVLWQKPTQDASSQQTGSSVYDFEGDGAADVVYNDEVRLRVYAGNNGAEKLNILGHGSGTLYEYPLVVDVDNDGQSEIVVINNSYAFGTKTGVTVYGDKDKSWRPGRKIWNQHAYYITNVNEDGTIPQFPSPNYKAYNNFRSGDLSPPDGKKTPDAKLKVPEPCVLECKDGKLVLWVHPGNGGASPVTTPVTIEVSGVVNGQATPLGQKELLDVIDPGKYLAAVAFEIDPAGLESITVKVSVQEQECDLANNEVVLQGPFCQ